MECIVTRRKTKESASLNSLEKLPSESLFAETHGTILNKVTRLVRDTDNTSTVWLPMDRGSVGSLDMCLYDKGFFQLNPTLMIEKPDLNYIGLLPLVSLLQMCSKYDTLGKLRGYNNTALLRPMVYDVESLPASRAKPSETDPPPDYPRHIRTLLTYFQGSDATSVTSGVWPFASTYNIREQRPYGIVCILEGATTDSNIPILSTLDGNDTTDGFDGFLVELLQQPKGTIITLEYSCVIISCAPVADLESKDADGEETDVENTSIWRRVEAMVISHVKHTFSKVSGLKVTAQLSRDRQHWYRPLIKGYTRRAAESSSFVSFVGSETTQSLTETDGRYDLYFVLAAMDHICMAGRHFPAIRERFLTSPLAWHDAFDRAASLLNGIDMRSMLPSDIGNDPSPSYVPGYALNATCDINWHAKPEIKDIRTWDRCLYARHREWDCHHPSVYGFWDRISAAASSPVSLHYATDTDTDIKRSLVARNHYYREILTFLESRALDSSYWARFTSIIETLKTTKHSITEQTTLFDWNPPSIDATASVVDFVDTDLNKIFTLYWLISVCTAAEWLQIFTPEELLVLIVRAKPTLVEKLFDPYMTQWLKNSNTVNLLYENYFPGYELTRDVFSFKPTLFTSSIDWMVQLIKFLAPLLVSKPVAPIS